MFVEEIRKDLVEDIIPFWEGPKDEENGGFRWKAICRQTNRRTMEMPISQRQNVL